MANPFVSGPGIDDSILGGFIAVINGKVYDASVRESMKTMKEFITDY